MDQLKITAKLESWPDRLVSLDSAAQSIGMEPSRLLEFVETGYAPHYRVEKQEPRFRLSELKEWAARNLLKRFEGKDLPTEIRVFHDPGKLAELNVVPRPLREIPNLRDLTAEVRSCGIYFLCFRGAVVYIGQSVNAVTRAHSHTDKLYDSVFFLSWPHFDLDRIEGALIRALRPPLNGENHNGTKFCPGGHGNPELDAVALRDVGVSSTGVLA